MKRIVIASALVGLLAAAFQSLLTIHLQVQNDTFAASARMRSL
jgi:hypothetical protein